MIEILVASNKLRFIVRLSKKSLVKNLARLVISKTKIWLYYLKMIHKGVLLTRFPRKRISVFGIKTGSKILVLGNRSKKEKELEMKEIDYLVGINSGLEERRATLNRCGQELIKNLKTSPHEVQLVENFLGVLIDLRNDANFYEYYCCTFEIGEPFYAGQFFKDRLLKYIQRFVFDLDYVAGRIKEEIFLSDSSSDLNLLDSPKE